MASASRLFRALVPRFGLLWLTAAMLLVVSGAGWWKFHRDLYVDECAAIEALKRSGAAISIVRTASPGFAVAEEATTEVPWNAPLLAPIEIIAVSGKAETAARDVALQLPRLKSYQQLKAPRQALSLAPDDGQGIRTHLERPLPELPEWALSAEDLDDALPAGEEVDAAESKRVAGAIRDAWRDSSAVPPRRLVVSEMESDFSDPFPHPRGEPMVRLHVIEPGRGLRYAKNEGFDRGESATLVLDGKVDWFDRVVDRWDRTSRYIDHDVPDETWLYRQFPDEDFPFFASDFADGFVVRKRMLESDEPYRFDRIARIDDVRYRIDFSPFEVPHDEGVFYSQPPQIVAWQCVVRSDLDWAPEAFRIVQMLARPGAPGPPVHHERLVRQRLRRVGDFVTLEERISRNIVGATPPAKSVGMLRSRYATEIDPELDERVFDPLALDPEPWPERRELPWVRWYRVAFALGCGLGMFLLGRKLSPRRKPSDDPLAPSKSEADDIHAETIA